MKLAAYFLLKEDEEKAKRIADDMRHEPKARLDQIRSSLENVTTKDFWEIIDRGRNFEFMPAPQKAAMKRFFEWFEPAG